ncbi:MAG: ankyrin repeat domain-containing protein [Endomicrobium sp.]|jgi:ankyrin repeat protein|nr:ankyrin repeat domain-containing protein [Endomicrobium sp.]
MKIFKISCLLFFISVFAFFNTPDVPAAFAAKKDKAALSKSKKRAGADAAKAKEEKKDIFKILEEGVAEEIRASINETNVNDKNADGDTPLLFVVKNTDNAKIIPYFKRLGANFEETDKDGFTPLMAALMRENINYEILSALIKSKANINAEYKKSNSLYNGSTVLHLILSAQDPDINALKLLIDSGAADVNAKNAAGLTPLAVAVSNNSGAQAISALLEAGANIEEKDARGFTPLMLALDKNYMNPEIAVFLIRSKAGVNVLADALQRGGDKHTPLLLAVNRPQTKPFVIKELIDAGADINVKNEKGQSPIMTAALKAYNKEVINVLAQAGAALNEPDADGNVPLILAITKNLLNHEIAVALITNKANANAVHKDDLMTPLMYALEDPSTPTVVINTLLKYHANVNAANVKGETPLMLAAKNHNDVIIKMLNIAKAKKDAVDADGKTAYDYALSNPKIQNKEALKQKKFKLF